MEKKSSPNLVLHHLDLSQAHGAAAEWLYKNGFQAILPKHAATSALPDKMPTPSRDVDNLALLKLLVNGLQAGEAKQHAVSKLLWRATADRHLDIVDYLLGQGANALLTYGHRPSRRS